MPAYSVSVPGKTILFGEHAVVYGYPAIAAPLNSIKFNINISARPTEKDAIIQNPDKEENILFSSLKSDHIYCSAINSILEYLRIQELPNINIFITSSIPISSGLGSSAAFAVCLTKALSGFLGFKLNNEQINEISFKIEVIQHGNPSGIDNSVITYEKPILFNKFEGPRFLEIRNPFTVIIADSGLRSSTKDVVAEVKKNYDKNRGLYNRLFQEIGKITELAKDFIEEGNIHQIGRLMNDNHNLLMRVGVSNSELDNLVKIARKSGASGAKLCGSGKGGNIVAIAEQEFAEEIKSALLNNGASNCFISEISTQKR